MIANLLRLQWLAWQGYVTKYVTNFGRGHKRIRHPRKTSVPRCKTDSSAERSEPAQADATRIALGGGGYRTYSSKALAARNCLISGRRLPIGGRKINVPEVRCRLRERNTDFGRFGASLAHMHYMAWHLVPTEQVFKH